MEVSRSGGLCLLDFGMGVPVSETAVSDWLDQGVPDAIRHALVEKRLSEETGQLDRLAL